jgi:hypothetical protein
VQGGRGREGEQASERETERGGKRERESGRPRARVFVCERMLVHACKRIAASRIEVADAAGRVPVGRIVWSASDRGGLWRRGSSSTSFCRGIEFMYACGSKVSRGTGGNERLQITGQQPYSLAPYLIAILHHGVSKTSVTHAWDVFA